MVKNLLNILNLIILFILIIVELSMAGRDTEVSDKYPKFTKIIQTETSIFFAGTWQNRFIIAEKGVFGNWEIYSTVANNHNIGFAIILEVSDGVLFNSSKKFLFKSKSWEKITSKKEQSLYRKQRAKLENNLTNISLNIIDKNIKMPLPSYNAFNRWRFPPHSIVQLDAKIGHNIKRNSELWFLIDFYDGEGYSGIGGLGIYDIINKKFGVIRHDLLASCSGGLLTNYGDTLIIATNHSGEYGTFGDRGIVLIDLNQGMIANLPKSKNPIDGDYFFVIKVIDNVLWLSSDRSIISWNLKKNIWKNIKCDSLISKKMCPIYRRPILYSDFTNGNLPTKVDYDSMIVVSYFEPGEIIECEWPSSQKAEISSNNEISGWMSKEKYSKFLKNLKYRKIPSYPLDILFTDSTLIKPYHSFGTSPIWSSKIYNKAVLVTIKGAWVDMADVEPFFSEMDSIPLPEIIWNRIFDSEIDVKKQAFQTFDFEQKEIRLKTPVFKNTFTFRDTMDLFKEFYNIIDARWLPPNKFDKKKSPQGIKLDNLTDFWVKNKKLEHNGKKMSIGDSVTTVDGDATYTYKILGYKVSESDNNHLIELIIKHTVVMIPTREEGWY